MREAARRFAGRVHVVGVHAAKFGREREDDGLAAALDRLGVTWPVVNDADHRIWDAYAIRAWPTLLLVDAAGRLVARHEGELPEAALLHALAELAGAGPDRPAPNPGAQPDGPRLRFPEAVLVEPDLDLLAIADTGNDRVLLCDPGGNVRHEIGHGPGFADGPAHAVRFRGPRGMALLPGGTALAVADAGNHALRAIDLRDGRVTTLAGTGQRGMIRAAGPGPATALASPWDLARAGDALWIAMAGMHQLWRYDPASGIVEPAAGSGAEALHDGPLAEAAFAQPMALAATPGGSLAVACAEASAVRLVSPAPPGRVRRLAGRGLFAWGLADGTGDAARLQHPQGIAADASDALWIADTYNHAVRRLDPATRSLSTLCGGAAGYADGDLAAALFRDPAGIAAASGMLCVADTGNHALRRIDLRRGIVETIEVRMG